jgi:hypothetical protein
MFGKPANFAAAAAVHYIVLSDVMLLEFGMRILAQATAGIWTAPVTGHSNQCLPALSAIQAVTAHPLPGRKADTLLTARLHV